MILLNYPNILELLIKYDYTFVLTNKTFYALADFSMYIYKFKYLKNLLLSTCKIVNKTEYLNHCIYKVVCNRCENITIIDIFHNNLFKCCGYIKDNIKYINKSKMIHTYLYKPNNELMIENKDKRYIYDFYLMYENEVDHKFCDLIIDENPPKEMKIKYNNYLDCDKIYYDKLIIHTNADYILFKKPINQQLC